MKKQTFLFLLALLLTISTFAQKRTTSVKGYTRKDGTYVRPHTRTYTPGLGSSSSTYSYSGSISNAKDDQIERTSLKFSIGNKTGGNSDYQGNVKYNGKRIGLTTLKFINEETTDENGVVGKKLETAIVFYVSVLRYKGKTLDVCPVPRSSSDWSFDKVDHKFDKKLISTEDALDLISNYGWHIYNDQVSKDFSYSYGDKGFPSYLTKTIEAIAVE